MTLQDSLDPTTVAFVMGFGAIVLALLKKPPVRGLYLFFGGFVWLCSAVTIFPDYGPEWVILTIGFGLLVLIEGALEVAEVI
jgi:hypothetical protein